MDKFVEEVKAATTAEDIQAAVTDLKEVEIQQNQLRIVDQAIKEVQNLADSESIPITDVNELNRIKDLLSKARAEQSSPNLLSRLIDAFMEAFRKLIADAKDQWKKLNGGSSEKNNPKFNEEFDALDDMQAEFEKFRKEATDMKEAAAREATAREEAAKEEATARETAAREEAAARAEANKTPKQRAFDTLGIDMTSFDALDESGKLSAIKKAFRKESLINHPDKGGSSEAMVKINNAYDLLKGIYS